MPNGDRYPCFDGLRCLAAGMIVVFHVEAVTTEFHRTGGSVMYALNSGVWIFFVISGFLLYRPFAASHLRRRPPVAVRGYALRRLARLYPAYWAALTILVATHRVPLTGTRNWLTHYSLLLYLDPRYSFFQGIPQAWSLTVELCFYAMLPLYAATVRRAARGRSATSIELASLAVLAAVGVASSAWYSYGTPPYWVGRFPVYLQTFAAGMLLAVLVSTADRPALVARLHRLGARPWIWWTLAAAAYLAIPFVVHVRPLAAVGSGRAFATSLCQTAFGLLIVGPMVLGDQRAGVLRRVLSSRPAVFGGLVSYGTYIWHDSLIQLVREHLGWSVGRGTMPVLLVLVIPFVVAVASLSWYALEAPILSRVRRQGSRAARVG